MPLTAPLSAGVSVSAPRTRSLLVCDAQTACGVEYTTKLQRMFQDMALSHELTRAFRATRLDTHPNSHTDAAHAAAVPGPELEVMVLTAGSWPVAATGAVVTCPEVRAGLCARAACTLCAG
jgi:hypothetical protein